MCANYRGGADIIVLGTVAEVATVIFISALYITALIIAIKDAIRKKAEKARTREERAAARLKIVNEFLAELDKDKENPTK